MAKRTERMRSMRRRACRDLCVRRAGTGTILATRSPCTHALRLRAMLGARIRQPRRGPLVAAAGLAIVAAVALARSTAGPLGRRGTAVQRQSVGPRRTLSDPVVLGLVTLTLGVQLAYAFTVEPLFDQDGYRGLGLDFATYWQTAELAAPMRTPGYPLFLSFNYELGLGDTGVKIM